MLLVLILLVPFLAGLACLPIRRRAWLQALNLAAFVAVGGLAAGLVRQVLANGPVEVMGGFLYADALSALVVGITAFVALACGLYAAGYLRIELDAGNITPRQLHRYYVLTPFFVTAMLLVPLANSLGIMWVAIEATTLSSVLLVTFYNERTSLEAAWKYIIIGSIGISLALFGTILAYYSAADVLGAETANGLNWTVLSRLADKFNPAAMRLAFILALLGYGTKAGLAPMHTWKPDAYAEAPVPSATLLAAGLVNCAIYGIVRFHTLTAKCVGPEFSGNLLIGFGVGSILVAVPFILVQRNFRRILAYSSIDHAGIMVAAVGFGGPLGALGALLHMVFHAAAKPLLFFCAGNVQQHFGTPYFRKVTGAVRTLPWTGALFLVASLAVTGTPPFSLFQSEFTALSAALAAHHFWPAALFTAGVATIFAGFLVHMSRLNLGPAARGAARGRECPWKLAAMLLVALPVVGFAFILPRPLEQLIQHAAQIIQGNP
ncbi:MAG: hydrogenase 4 subunit F [Verrucomicrobia bacterium]|nr:hydrogenase 4 subunit F [Verrucomicrobiota bacterium]